MENDDRKRLCKTQDNMCGYIWCLFYSHCSFTLFPQQKWEYVIKSDMITLLNEKKHIIIHTTLDWFENNFKEVKNENEKDG